MTAIHTKHIYLVATALETFQLDKSPLKLSALLNMPDNSVDLDTSHVEILPLKLAAATNVPIKLSADEVSQLDRS